MACESPRRRLREEVTCPICLEYFASPVTLVCEHNFCHSCILQSLDISPTNDLCPLCKRPFRQEDLTLNYSVASFARLIKLLNDQEEGAEIAVCGRHQEPLKLFCKDSEVLICTSCQKEHQDHNIVSVEEAAQECKDRISASLEALKKQREEMMVTVSAVQEKCEGLLKQMATERQKTATSFQNLWPFLMKQEYHALTWMKWTEKQIERKRDLHMDQLNEKLSSLEDLIQEMEKKRQLSASWLLQNAQDVGSILKRSEQTAKLKNPPCFLPALRQNIFAFTKGSVILEGAMEEFEDTMTSCY